MDKKPGLLLAIGAGPKLKSKGPEPEAHDEERMGMQESAMMDFIDAVHSKDAAGALAAYQDLCALHEDPAGDEYDA